MYLIGALIIAGLTAGFATSVALFLRRVWPNVSLKRRRWIAPTVGAVMAMSPAFVSAAKEGAGPILAVLLFAGVLALLAGYPAVRFFDPPPSN